MVLGVLVAGSERAGIGAVSGPVPADELVQATLVLRRRPDDLTRVASYLQEQGVSVVESMAPRAGSASSAPPGCCRRCSARR